MIELINYRTSVKSIFDGIPHFYTYSLRGYKPGNFRLGISIDADPKMVMKWLKLRNIKIGTLTTTGKDSFEIQTKKAKIMEALKDGGILQQVRTGY